MSTLSFIGFTCGSMLFPSVIDGFSPINSDLGYLDKVSPFGVCHPSWIANLTSLFFWLIGVISGDEIWSAGRRSFCSSCFTFSALIFTRSPFFLTTSLVWSCSTSSNKGDSPRKDKMPEASHSPKAASCAFPSFHLAGVIAIKSLLSITPSLERSEETIEPNPNWDNLLSSR